ncbi:serine/threonine protein kinase [Actinoplanes sp. LDG1-06]|uniref:non-specific serine/threonine protein kinase n=1 Tax=Paractinoplanes ovalisporus TaxID=2810368 RepID=A0ABS2AM64_9ACTN|nr:serine/threonine-protein kinase [Actinoplanes ovalisporus]MBM2620925.1 serine/threonine protein kinase [Actinoplanes ovalisporus]
MADFAFIGRYRTVRRLGSGAFADVFLAVDEDLESPVAIKVLAERWAFDPDVRERFLNEARLLRRLGGERLVSVHDIGQTPDGRPYFVMPYADRGTLEERLAELAAAGRVVPPDAAFTAVRAVALALRPVHEAGVVHRDVKPGNVLIFGGGGSGSGSGGDGDASPLVAADERLVLGDFGLAKDLSQGGTALSLPVGTPGYMAPEQSDAGAAVDQRADVYACTALLTRILAGRLPSGGALEESLSGEIGPAVRRTLLSGLDPAPARRPASAGQWLSDLDTAVAADRKPRRRRLVPLLAAALVVAVGVAAAAFVAWPRPEAPAAAPAPAIRFEEVFDDTRSISLRVPAAWSQHWGNGWHPGQSPFYGNVNVGPGLNASPNVSDWFTKAAVPGVFAGVSSRVVKQGKFSPDFMRQYFGPNGCTAAAGGPFRLDRLGLTGVQGEWSCPGGIRWRYAYGWPAHHRYLVALEIKLVAPDQDQAWTEALASVAVHTEPPNG